MDISVVSKPLDFSIPISTTTIDDSNSSSEGNDSNEIDRNLITLEATDPRHITLLSMARANGNVSTNIGWHARKMEVLEGLGMLGREDGIYGFHAYA